MRQIVLFAVSLLATCGSVALVAQPRYLSDSPGRWKPWTFTAYGDDRGRYGAKPADLKALEAQLLRLNDIIKKTPGITTPIGFSAETGGQLDGEDVRSWTSPGAPAITVRPLPATLGFGPFPILEFGSGATATRDDGGETAHVHFQVNHLMAPLTQAPDSFVPEFDKLAVDVVRLAAPQPDVLGFPRYGNVLVLKKNDSPLWAAVTFSEALDLVARAIDARLTEQRDAAARVQKAYDDAKDPKKREERLAQYRKIAPQVKDPAYMEKMTKAEDEIATRADKEFLPNLAIVKEAVAKSERELASVRTMSAGLSATDKAAPACYDVSDKVSLSRFRRTPSPGCAPLVRPNWKLFNPALPRSAPQVLTISGFLPRCLVPARDGNPGGCTANNRLLESIDKAALLAWLQ